MTDQSDDTPPLEKIRVGISSCLLGFEVRFDKGHKRDSYINGTLGEYFEFVPVCPEMAIGLGTPREPIRLVGDPDRPRAVGVKTEGHDVTEALEAYGLQLSRELHDISGYILKRGSPSCGMERVKLYHANRMPGGHTSGVYARVFMQAQPLLPMEEEGRLSDPILRENFIQRVFVYHRWQALETQGMTPARLVGFHTRHKLMVMAHSQAAYQRLGRRVARAGSEPMEELARAYVTELMDTLKRRASRKQHANEPTDHAEHTPDDSKDEAHDQCLQHDKPLIAALEHEQDCPVDHIQEQASEHAPPDTASRGVPPPPYQGASHEQQKHMQAKDQRRHPFLPRILIPFPARRLRIQVQNIDSLLYPEPQHLAVFGG